jgi:hypothetical protein
MMIVAFSAMGLCAALPAAEMRELLPLLPKDANALVVLQIRELTNSPRGQKEGWAAQHETEFLVGAANIPPWVELFVRASREHPGAGGPAWTTVLIPLPEGYNMEDLARREGTEVQQIDEHAAVWSPRYNGYFVDLTPPGEQPLRVLGGITPATRQDVARWLADFHRGLGVLGMSDYLVTAANDPSAQIMLAVDLQEMLDPVLIRYRIDGAAALQDRPEAKPGLVILYQTLRGVKLTVRVEETTQAELRMDFGRKVGDEGQYVKPLLIELLNDMGAAIDELDDAAVEVGDRTVTLRMPLSDESLRRVMSLATAAPAPPGPPPPAAEQPPTPPSPGSTGADVTASRRYFSAVNRNIDDLGRAYARARSYARTAQWHQNFARRIDHLPATGVDPDLIDYGQSMSAKLRALAASLRGVAVKVNALEQSIVYNVYYDPGYGGWGYGWTGWWGWGWWGPQWYGQPPRAEVTSNLQEVRANQAELVAASAPERDQIWQMINEERAAMQRTMVGRYGEALLR